MRKLLPGLFAGALALAACTDKYTICDTSVNVTVNATFYAITAGIPQAAAPAGFSLSRINGPVIFTDVSNRTTFYAQLDPATDTSRFLLQFGTTLPLDTLTLVYSTQVQNVSADCGNINLHTLSHVSTTTHAVDSVKLINPAVNTLLSQNLQIFFKR